MYDGPPVLLPEQEGAGKMKKYKQTKLLAVAHAHYKKTQLPGSRSVQKKWG